MQKQNHYVRHMEPYSNPAILYETISEKGFITSFNINAQEIPPDHCDTPLTADMNFLPFPTYVNYQYIWYLPPRFTADITGSPGSQVISADMTTCAVEEIFTGYLLQENSNIILLENGFGLLKH